MKELEKILEEIDEEIRASISFQSRRVYGLQKARDIIRNHMNDGRIIGMSKGMIVVDMPEKCCNCRMGFENEYYDQFECYFKPGKRIKPDDGKADWCPIRPLPDPYRTERSEGE